MGAVNSIEYNNYTYTNAILVLSGFPTASKIDGMARGSFDLYPSQEAYQSVKDDSRRRDMALCRDFLTVNIYAKKKFIQQAEMSNPQGGTTVSVVSPDVVRMWGDEPNNPVIPLADWPENAPGQFWAMCMRMDRLASWTKDEATTSVTTAKKTKKENS